MKFSPTQPRRVFQIVIVGVASSASALAHPGHNGDHGGGLTWDFVGEVLHRLSSPYHLAPAVVVGVIALMVWRKVRAKRERDGRDASK